MHECILRSSGLHGFCNVFFSDTYESSRSRGGGGHMTPCSPLIGRPVAAGRTVRRFLYTKACVFGLVRLASHMWGSWWGAFSLLQNSHLGKCLMCLTFMRLIQRILLWGH